MFITNKKLQYKPKSFLQEVELISLTIMNYSEISLMTIVLYSLRFLLVIMYILMKLDKGLLVILMAAMYDIFLKPIANINFDCSYMYVIIHDYLAITKSNKPFCNRPWSYVIFCCICILDWLPTNNKV